MKIKLFNVCNPELVSRARKQFLLTVMRAFLLLFFTTALGFNTDYSYAQTQVSIEASGEITVDEVFQLITEQTKYNFLYPGNFFADLPKVKLTKGVIKVDELIAQSIPKSKFNVVLSEGNTIIIEESNSANQLSVSGTVTDGKGTPIPYVYIRIKGTNEGVATDFDGYYKIAITSANNVLIFNSLGFKEKEVLVGDRLVVDVVLEPDVTELDAVEVVSTGYQKMAKERSAGSFSKPEMSIAKDRTYSMNILQRIDGLVAGLTINNSPGAASNPYLIRGLTSIGTFGADNVSASDYDGNTSINPGTNRSPLFVVDGIPTNNISFINPQDVEDITVLKDATAASIWGARAANGVIVVTTKKAKNNSKLTISYDAFTNIQGRPELDYQPYMNSAAFIKAAREVFDPESYPFEQLNAYTYGASGIPPHLRTLYAEYMGEISSDVANARLDSLSGLSNRGQIRDIWYRQAMQSNHTLTLSAGGVKHSIYSSVAYTDTKNNRPGDSDKQFKLNIRQDYRFNDRISAFLITDFTKAKALTKNNLDIDYGFFPYQLFQNENGEHISIPFMGSLTEDVRAEFEARSRVNLNYNPLDERNYADLKSDVFNGRFIGGVDVGIFENLNFLGTYSYIQGARKSTNYISPESYSVRSELVQFTVADTPDDDPVYYLPETGGRYTEGHTTNRNFTIRNQVSYDNSWNEGKHQLSLLVGQEAQEQLTESTSTTVRGYNPLLLTSVPVDYAFLEKEGIENPVMPNSGNLSILSDDYFTQSEILTRFTSYYANVGYTFNRKYTFNGSWRRDQSNLFGLDKSAQNKPSWSLGTKWALGRESFLSGVTTLNFLDLRATYGITGNAPTPGVSSTYDILRPQTDYTVLSNRIPLTISTPGNPKLTWERTSTLNLGIDFGIFDRINASVDVYRKMTDDLLGQLPLNIFSGFTSAIGNFGSLENKGIELTLNTKNIQTQNFSWTTLLTMAYNKNKITQLALPGEVTTGDQKVDLAYLKGFPAFAVFAYDYKGLDAEGDPLIQLQDGTITKEPNVTTADDILFMGTSQPVWSGGLSNTFSYKGFNLSVNAVYNLGHVMRKDITTNFSGLLENVPFTDFANRWKEPGDELVTNIPYFDPTGTLSGATRDIDYYIKGSQNVLDASYVKLRDITLSYGLPKEFLQKINVKDLTLRFSVSNLMLWTANKYDIDPEFQFSSLSRGVRAVKTNQGSVALGLHFSL